MKQGSIRKVFAQHNKDFEKQMGKIPAFPAIFLIAVEFCILDTGVQIIPQFSVKGHKLTER